MTTTRTPVDPARLQASATVGAPVALLAGVAVMKLGWKGRGDLPWSEAIANWTVGHVFSVLGNVLLVFALLALYRLLARGSAAAGQSPAAQAVSRVALFAGVLGCVTMAGQMLIDLRNGFLATDRASLKSLSAEVHAIPELDVLFYGLVPALSLVGLVVLVIQLAAARAIPVMAAAATTGSTLLIGTGSTAHMLIGGALLCVALLVVGRAVVADGAGRAFVDSGNDGRPLMN